MTADNFIRDRFAWLDQILSDPDAPAQLTFKSHT